MKRNRLGGLQLSVRSGHKRVRHAVPTLQALRPDITAIAEPTQDSSTAAPPAFPAPAPLAPPPGAAPRTALAPPFSGDDPRRRNCPDAGAPRQRSDVEHLLHRGRLRTSRWSWEPTGCATAGGASAAHAGYRICELDGADPSDWKELRGWLKTVRQSRAEARDGAPPNAILLDDYESFTEDMRERTASLLAEETYTWTYAGSRAPPGGCDLGAAHPKLVGVLEGKERRFRASEMHARFSLSVADALGNYVKTSGNRFWTLTCARDPRRNAPLIITCTKPKERTNRALQSYRQFALRAPSLEQYRFLLARPGEVVSVPDDVAEGDVRRARIAVEWQRTFGSHDEVGAASARAFDSAFRATHALLLRACDAEEWVQATEARDCDLVRHHLASYVQQGTGEHEEAQALARLSRAYDAFADIDAGQPRQYELRQAHAPLLQHAAALSVRTSSRAKSVGLLTLPPQTRGGTQVDLDTPRALL